MTTNGFDKFNGMIFSLLTFVFGLIVYDQGPPAIIGVGDTQEQATQYVTVLKNFLEEKRLVRPAIGQFVHYKQHTVYRSDTHLSCLPGILSDLEQIKTRVTNLRLAYESVFDKNSQLKNPLPQNTYPMQRDPNILEPAPRRSTDNTRIPNNPNSSLTEPPANYYQLLREKQNKARELLRSQTDKVPEALILSDLRIFLKRCTTSFMHLQEITAANQDEAFKTEPTFENLLKHWVKISGNTPIGMERIFKCFLEFEGKVLGGVPYNKINLAALLKKKISEDYEIGLEFTGFCQANAWTQRMFRGFHDGLLLCKNHDILEDFILLFLNEIKRVASEKTVLAKTDKEKTSVRRDVNNILVGTFLSPQIQNMMLWLFLNLECANMLAHQNPTTVSALPKPTPPNYLESWNKLAK